MALELHPKTMWLPPTLALDYAKSHNVKCSRQKLYDLMTKRVNGRILIRSKENPLRRGQGARLLHRGDVEKHVLHFN